MPKFVDQASNSDKNTVSERQIQLNTVDPVEEKAKQTNPEAQNPNLNTSDLWRGSKMTTRAQQKTTLHNQPNRRMKREKERVAAPGKEALRKRERDGSLNRQ